LTFIPYLNMISSILSSSFCGSPLYSSQIVVGRKNWLFCDTQAGANASVAIFTLLETAKANGLNPEAYLNHLLTVLPERFAADPQMPIDDLMPWNHEMQRAFLSVISDADH